MSDPSPAPRPRHPSLHAPLGAVLALLLLLGVTASGVASGTRDALEVDTGAQTASAAADLAEAEADFQRAQAGLTAELTVEPGVAYVDPRDNPATDPAGFEFGIAVGADVGYRYDRVDILANDLRRIDALRDARGAVIGAREDVLIAHATLLAAQLDAELTRLNLERERAIRDGLTGTPASSAEVRAVDLAVARRAAAAADAQRRLERAQRVAADYGLDTTATFEPIRFALPPRELAETLRQRDAELTLQLAYAERDEDTIFSVLDNVGVGLTYENPGYRVGARIDLDEGRPGIGVSADYGTPDRDSLTVELSATIAIDAEIGTRSARANRDIANSMTDLAELRDEYPQTLARLRDDADAAWRDLQFELEGVAIADARSEEVVALLARLPEELAAKEAEVATLNEAIAAAPNVTERDAARSVWQEALAELRQLERSFATAQRDAERGAEGATRAQRGVYRAWETYIRRVADYLVLAERGWREASE